jgi:hypothetical protein
MLFDLTKHYNNMKRLKINLSLVAIVLGTSAAFAGVKVFQSPNVYNTGTNSNPVWTPIPPLRSVSCDATINQCEGFQAVSGGPVTDITQGKATLH